MRNNFGIKFLVTVLCICGAAALTLSLPRLADGDALGEIKAILSPRSEPSETDENSENDAWQLILVNADNPLPDGFHPELTELSGGHRIDKRVYPHLQKMFDDARQKGIRPAISSSYRTAEQQQAELDQKTEEYIRRGYSREKALETAKKWAAVPGTSEHQTGLAIDITTADASVQAADVVWKWLEKNSYKYGFIKRYPEDKTEITGISNEPWHFRYVGPEAAKEIKKRGICLEEYLEAPRKK